MERNAELGKFLVIICSQHLAKLRKKEGVDHGQALVEFRRLSECLGKEPTGDVKVR